MKKFLLLVLPFYLFTCLPIKADEGMWTLYNLPNAVYETMKQENYELPYGALYQGDDAIKNCIVALRLSAVILPWSTTIC